MIRMTGSFLLICLTLLSTLVKAQSVTLEEAYALARQNYPLIKQQELIEKSKLYSLENAQKGNLPQFSVNGQATYQSDVTHVPVSVPGLLIPLVSKDQYKMYGEVNQSLYDGGLVKNQKRSIEVNAGTQAGQLEVELYALKNRINQLFFGVLLLDEQLKQVDLLKADLQIGINRVQAAVNNGVSFRSNVDVLRAELLKAEQNRIGYVSARKAYTDVLKMFLNREVNEQTVFVKPQPLQQSAEIDSVVISRPEIKLYELQQQGLEVQQEMLSIRNRPRVSLFAQAGYGRPGLNMLKNEFDFYYIGGIKLGWSLSGLYTTKRERLLIAENQKSIGVSKETFLFNTRFSLKQQYAESDKFRQLLATDDEIVLLRMNVKKAAFAQLENGVISASDYLREVNAEDQSKQNRFIHEVQLLLAQYNQQTLTGN